jgi:hypothetical protein
MDSWPATKEEVEAEIARVAKHAGPEIWARYATLLIDPYSARMDRFGQTDQVFVVARMPHRVVFFDDIEDIFGTAREVDGKLDDVAMYGDLRLALREAEAGA